MEGNGRLAAGGETGDAADLEAVSETLRGNREAFRVIVERHEPMVLRLAAAFLRDPEEAREASQEIFLKAFRALRSFDLEKRFLPWLRAVAVNYLRTRYRQNRRRQERFVPSSDDLPSGDGASDPVSAAEDADTRERLRRAIEALPAPVREAVTLYYTGGMSVAEIAQSLGIGMENVKSRLHRGRKGIREQLEQDATRRTGGEYTYTGS